MPDGFIKCFRGTRGDRVLSISSVKSREERNWFLRPSIRQKTLKTLTPVRLPVLLISYCRGVYHSVLPVPEEGRYEGTVEGRGS